jgi:putative colanic acid biosynthesis glycosyltransferase WcaI
MATFHILTQYIWPDAAPTGLYAEHLATRLHEQGWDVRLVGGSGNYRALGRDKPPVPILHLNHFCGRRGKHAQVLAEYTSVKRAFATYIDTFVRPGDVVIVTTAPPSTVQLANRIKRRGARAIYWLQDYYPELIRGMYEYPVALRRAFSSYWDHLLRRWDRVVKIGSNLAGPAGNSVVIRNWPTFTFETDSAPEPGTALYSGNLGYGHDVDLLVAACQQLRDAGYRITIRADGRGARRLPSWLPAQPLHSDPEELKCDLSLHEVHLIAGHPRIRRAIFPSKIWNSIALGRRVICTGFAGEMVTELEAVQTANFNQHLDQWVELISSVSVSFAAHSEMPQPAESMPDLRPAAVA